MRRTVPSFDRTKGRRGPGLEAGAVYAQRAVSSSGHQCQLAEGHSAGGNGHGGSAQAAAYWYLDAKRVDSSASHRLLAGGFNYSSSRCVPTSCYYLAGYFRK